MGPDLLLRVAYNGSAFSGFQWQSNKPSIQAAIEDALCIALHQKELRIRFGSRTDAGVHAYDHLVLLRNGFELLSTLTKRRQDQFLLSLNHLLGGKIVVWQARRVRSNFDWKRDLVWKEYEYRVFNSKHQDPLNENHWWLRKELDIEKIKSSLKTLEGSHDFSAFAKSSGRELKERQRSTTRNILAVDLKIQRHPVRRGAQTLKFRFRADGFLHYMVRNMVGSLVDIGGGADINLKAVLQNRSRQQAGRRAPANGLFLMETKVVTGVSRIIPLGHK